MLQLKKIVWIAGIAAVTGVTGCSSWGHHSDARSSARIDFDRRITSEVKNNLANEPVYKFNNVDVKTYDGVVQLSGFVLTDAQKQRAANLAENVPGVNRVVNAITVQPNNTMPTGRNSGQNQNSGQGQNSTQGSGSNGSGTQQQNQSGTNQ